MIYALFIVIVSSAKNMYVPIKFTLDFFCSETRRDLISYYYDESGQWRERYIKNLVPKRARVVVCTCDGSVT